MTRNGISRRCSCLNVTFFNIFNVGKVNFSVLRIIFSPLSPFLSRIAQFNAISRHFLFHLSTRTKFLSYVFHLVSKYEILPQIQWRFKRTSFRGVLGMSQLESFRESNMQYPITHVLGGEKQDASLLERKRERQIRINSFSRSQKRIEFRFRVDLFRSFGLILIKLTSFIIFEYLKFSFYYLF